MSKAQSPTPGPSPVGRGAVCLAACLSSTIYNIIRWKLIQSPAFLWICKEKNIFIDILSLKICTKQINVIHLHKTKIEPSYE